MVYGKSFVNNNIARIPEQNVNARKIPRDKSFEANNTVNNQSSVFGKILNDQINKEQGIKFSKHAEFRLKARNINLSNQQVDKINQAVAKAEEKGVSDSLILMDEIALVVSVKNKTVVTVASKNELKDNIFTNIDGTVII